jgi:hypothetical protein
MLPSIHSGYHSYAVEILTYLTACRDSTLVLTEKDLTSLVYAIEKRQEQNDTATMICPRIIEPEHWNRHACP